jgi:uncharacterized membrane protein HdeD (DUF308 family)
MSSQPKDLAMTETHASVDRSRVVQALEKGVASFIDLAWVAMTRELARKAGHVIVADGRDARTRGVLGVTAGVSMIMWPDPSLRAIGAVFGAYALLDGLLSLLALISWRQRFWQVLAQGVASLALGVVVFARPDLSRMALLYLLAAWVVVMAAVRLRTAVDFRNGVRIRWLPALLALLAVVGAGTVFVAPERGLASVMINLAVFAILNGIALIAGERARRAGDEAP